MPAWEKSPQSLQELFAEALPNDPRIERRKMFGYPAAFVNGHMMAGCFQDGMFARLSPSDMAERAAAGWKPFEPMAGRPMKDYLGLPQEVLEDEAATAAILAKALSWTAAMPPKEKKPAMAKKAAKG
jgi:TfoX/Sxy family transcriptional regulator of competence genes